VACVYCDFHARKEKSATNVSDRVIDHPGEFDHHDTTRSTNTNYLKKVTKIEFNEANSNSIDNDYLINEKMLFNHKYKKN